MSIAKCLPVLLFFSFVPLPGIACECAKGVSEAADLHFIGTPYAKVTAQVREGWKEIRVVDVTRHRFRVKRSIKGPGVDDVVVESTTSDCAQEFDIGSEYEVYALRSGKDDSIWITGICLLNRKSEQ